MAMTVIVVVTVVAVRVTVVVRMTMPVMFVAVVVRMTMPVMIMPVPVTMIMMMAVIMLVRAVPFGLERRDHHLGLEAAFPEQHHNLGIGKHAQAIGQDLDGNVAVAQRQNQPCRLGEILLAHLQHLLHVGHHFDETAVVEHQEIVGAQQRRGREIEFDAGSLAAEHEALLLHAVFEFEQQRVGDFAGAPIAGAEDFLGAGHRALPIQRRVCRSRASAPESNGTTDDGRAASAADPTSGASTLPASTLTASTLVVATARASRRAYSR